jgi:ligand-binding sensor domain-containing protein
MTAVCAGASSAPAQGTWVNHVHPSLVSDMVLRGNDLYMASGGGLLVYHPADSTFRQFTNDKIGLPSNYLTCLAFDPGGSIYVGTQSSGIARLDFVSGGFAVSALNATFHGLSDDRITTLAAWGDSIAYGTRQGAGLIVEGFPTLRFFTRDGLPSDVVSDVFADGEYLWFATDQGVARLDALGFITTYSTGLPSLDAHVFARDDTSLWVGTAAGVARFDPPTGSWIPAGLGNQSVFAIAFDGSKLWATSYTRFFENGGGGWIERDYIPVYAKYGLGVFAEPRALQPMPNGSVYMGLSDAGSRRGAFLMIFDGTRVFERIMNAPPSNDLRRAAFDVDGSVWVSSADFGVGKLTPSSAWFNYTPTVGDTNLTSLFTNLALLPDSKGSKWFCSLAGYTYPKLLDELSDGLDRSYTNDVWVHHDIGSGGGDGLGSMRNQRAAEDPVGNRWFLSDVNPNGPTDSPPEWRGISILSEDKSAWRHVNPTSTNGGMPQGNITSVAFGAAGVAWVADLNAGVLEWRTGGYDPANLFDLSGNEWTTVGTVGGDFKGGDVTSLALRGDGVLWVGTTEGVFKLEDGAFQGIGFDQGLLSNTVLDLALDHDDNLWVATNLGLCRIARDENVAIRSFTTPNVWQKQLSILFPPDVVSPIAEAVCNDLAMHPTRDLLYIATAGGLSILDVASLEPSTGDISKVYVFPNPIRTRRGHSSLKIANHDRQVDVEIYTLEGELVHRALDVPVGEDVVWDLTTSTGYLAASGVYVVRIRSGSETVIKRVSLIR